jgi:hypothetical protein
MSEQPLIAMPFLYSSGEEIRKADRGMGSRVRLNLSPIRLKALTIGL